MKQVEFIVECSNVKFFAPHDEDAFFEWLAKISCVDRVKGKKNAILLYFKSQIISNEELRSLTALFRRYKIKTNKLEIFVNEANKESFEYFKHGLSINIYPNTDDK